MTDATRPTFGDRVATTSLPRASRRRKPWCSRCAVNHLTEREAVVRETALTATALRRAVGLAGPGEVRAEIKRLVGQGTLIEAVPAYRMADPCRSQGRAGAVGCRLEKLSAGARRLVRKQAQQYVGNAIKRGSLVPAEKRYTTQKALAREKAILAIERTGRTLSNRS